MSVFDYRTAMGGENEAFQTTCWFDIRKARTKDPQQSRQIIENLLNAYWKPVYCYLRQKGHENESAKDLTQGFFYEIVLGKELIQKADQSKGKFRTFLLTALDHYVSNVYHKEKAAKRSPEGQIMHLSTMSDGNRPDILDSATPDQAFHYAWASELLDNVLEELKNECFSSGMEKHWEVFNAKVLAEVFGSEKVPELVQICEKFGIESTAKASNMIVTVKRRFGAILRRHLREFVDSDSQVEDEYGELLKILSKDSAR